MVSGHPHCAEPGSHRPVPPPNGRLNGRLFVVWMDQIRPFKKECKSSVGLHING